MTRPDAIIYAVVDRDGRTSIRCDRHRPGRDSYVRLAPDDPRTCEVCDHDEDREES